MLDQHADHDAYIAAAPEPFQPELGRLRDAVRAAIPDAVEIVSYNTPGFAIDGRTVVGYAAFSKQCGLYLPAEAIAAHSDAITAAGLKHTKTGVTLTATKPIPDDLLTELLEASRRATGS